MHDVEYYERPNGDKPARDWLCALKSEDRKLASLIEAKLLKLSEEGLKLLGTKMLEPIKGRSNLYEIVAGQARLCVYHEIAERRFLALYGFRKKKQRETMHIERCCQLLDEYIAHRKKGGL